MDLDLLVGSGGVLSHAPRREQSAKMLIDAFMPEGITQLAVDSIFMMPQLGVLAHVDKEDFAEDARKAALEVFHKDCLIRLVTCLAPVGKSKPEEIVLTTTLTLSDGSVKEQELKYGQILRLDLPYEPINAILKPSKTMDIGAGNGQEIQTDVFGGTVGLIFDGRDRPITIPGDQDKRIESLRSWSRALNEYPDNSLK